MVIINRAISSLKIYQVYQRINLFNYLKKYTNINTYRIK